MLNPNEDDPYVLWAEITKLKAALEGPEGFATWQEAVISERIRRVKAEKELDKLKLENSFTPKYGMSETEIRSMQGIYG